MNYNDIIKNRIIEACAQVFGKLKPLQEHIPPKYFTAKKFL